MDMHLLNSPHKPCIVTSVKCRNNAKKMDRVQMLERLNHYHSCSYLSSIAFIFITKFNLPNDVKSRDWRRKSESTISATLRPENIPPTPRKPIVILSLGEINKGFNVIKFPWILRLTVLTFLQEVSHLNTTNLERT